LNSELEQLRKLVLDGGFDEESKQRVLNLEKRLRKLAETERLNELPAIKEFLAYMESEITRSELLLKSDESLTDLQRSKLFAIIQVSEKYTRLFNGKARQSVEEIIKRELDAARSS
jgi:Spy/CpxP family protein refolding chaperone